MNDIAPETDAAVEADPAAEDRSSANIDLANRPDAEWLNTVKSELDDTDLVLKCLARESAKMCQTCDALRGQRMLDGRPMLARCASTKEPR